MSLIVETRRLVLRELEPGDAEFILELVNDPDWLRHIGDRGVNNSDDALRFIEEGPLRSYRDHGHGLWLTALKKGDLPIGLCGFLKRDSLQEADLGYALLPAYRRQGYAQEACLGALEYAADALARSQVLAIVSPGNVASVRLLERLQFCFVKPMDFGPEGSTVHLYSRVLS